MRLRSRILFVVLTLVLAMAGILMFSHLSGKGAVRTVGFDNIYGATQVTVHVSIDGARERRLTARCTKTTCSFKVALTNARHQLALAVEQRGKRSSSTNVELDTTNMR